MTRTVERKPITQAMQLALWKRHGLVKCAECQFLCNDANAGAVVITFPDGTGLIVRDFHWDHHLALVDGGTHDVKNIRPLCLHCHRDKSAREHKNNAKAKRLAAAREAHQRGEKKASRMKSRGFDTHLSKKFNGQVVPRTPATAET